MSEPSWMDDAVERTQRNAKPECEHEWRGWREFEDGRGGERVCKKCGLGAMQHTLMKGI